MYLNLDTFAGRLTAALNHKGWTQVQLAQTLGIHRQAITSIKVGQAPGRKHLPAMARALDVSIDWLVTGAESHSPLWIREPPRVPSALANDAYRLEGVLQALREASGDAEARARLLQENETLKATVATLRSLMQEREMLDGGQIREAALGLPEVVSPSIPAPALPITPPSGSDITEIAGLRQRISLLEEALSNAEERAREWEAKHDQVAKDLRAERDYHRQQLKNLISDIPHAAALARRVGRGLPWRPPQDDE